MTDLTPLTALGATAPRQLRLGGLSLEEWPDLALASVAGAGLAPFGLALPAPGCMVADGAHLAWWMAPGQWMIARPGAAETDFAADLAADLAGSRPPARITEQTDAFVALALTGAEVDAALERLVNLAPAARGPGRATRTGLHHMAVFVLRPEPGQVVFLGMRSAAESLWHVLEEVLHHLAARAAN